MPLQRRIPKRGFTNLNRVEYQVVNVRDLSRIEAGEVTPEVLGTGEIEGAYQVSAHRFSGAARKKIEGAGGTVTLLAGGGGSETAGEEGPVTRAAKRPAPEVEEREEASPPGGEEAPEAEDEKA
jgi:hypothetical protein